ncbi:hypothetical protein HYR69_11060, partial [Candidatus Sumerlaeota bacterium]|nr:hypothetical protein [Candidatus Sumerlaeota bacterium]
MKNKIPIILAVLISLAPQTTRAQDAPHPERPARPGGRVSPREPILAGPRARQAAGKVDPATLAAIASARQLPAKLDAAAKSDLEETIKALKQGDTAKATEAWRNFAADYASPANRENI